MTESLHELSVRIGDLQAQARERASAQGRIEDKVDRLAVSVAGLQQSVVDQTAQAVKAALYADKDAATLLKAIDEMNHRVMRLETTSNRRAGATAFVGMVIGAVSEFVLNMIFKTHA